MGHAVKITVLMENTAGGRGTRSEHGLAYWIEHDGRHLLFDTGQSDLLLHNAARFQLDLQQLDAVVLSHGHYDHTGGLMHVLERAQKPDLYVHPSAFGRKYSRHDNGTLVDVGMPQREIQPITDRVENLVWTCQPTHVHNALHVTGFVPRRHDDEDVGGRFFTDAQGEEPDPLWDDQAIYFDTEAGVVVVLGCAHAGVVNTMDYVAQLTGRPIFAVIGGMHLLAASETRLDATVDAMRRHDVQRLAPAHCTGIRATARLWTTFPDRCMPCAVGSTFTFE
jgi:7,8-dihydropterin-6-yl-methyl-4-(beta-D-ribofuranosyl)aminobenzene 5'-phosphate synthase